MRCRNGHLAPASTATALSAIHEAASRRPRHLTSAGCSKRQISFPNMDQNVLHRKLAMNLGLALGNECSGKVQEALAVRADGTVSEPRAESP